MPSLQLPLLYAAVAGLFFDALASRVAVFIAVASAVRGCTRLFFHPFHQCFAEVNAASECYEVFRRKNIIAYLVEADRYAWRAIMEWLGDYP
jgi:hypothetical protein